MGILGSFASIISLFIPASRWSQLIHAAYVAFIVGLVLTFVTYQKSVNEQLSELDRIKRIESQADALLKPRDLSTSGNKAGYALAVLAFLEKNKKLYPDTYERAEALSKNAGCTKAERQSGNDAMDHFSRMQDVSAAMKVLLQGVSTLGGE